MLPGVNAETAVAVSAAGASVAVASIAGVGAAASEGNRLLNPFSSFLGLPMAGGNAGTADFATLVASLGAGSTGLVDGVSLGVPDALVVEASVVPQILL